MNTSYVVTLNPSAKPNIQTMALMACRSNNRKQSSKLTLEEFRDFFWLHYEKDPEMKCELSHNFLSVDQNIRGKWQNMIFVQEVDIFSAEEEDEDHGG